MASRELFLVPDLHSEKSLIEVVEHIYALSAYVSRFPGYSGPTLAARRIDLESAQAKRKAKEEEAEAEYRKAHPRKAVAPRDAILRNGNELFGLDAELEMKARETYSPEELAVVARWIELVCGEKVRWGSLVEFGEDLKTGVILCRFMNAIQPPTRQIHDIYEGEATFKQRDNIQKFSNCCRALGMKESDCVLPNDLNELRYLPVVVHCLFVLSQVLSRNKSYTGALIQVARKGEIPEVVEKLPPPTPFWKSPWFWTGVVGAATLGGFLYFRTRYKG